MWKALVALSCIITVATGCISRSQSEGMTSFTTSSGMLEMYSKRSFVQITIETAHMYVSWEVKVESTGSNQTTYLHLM